MSEYPNKLTRQQWLAEVRSVDKAARGYKNARALVVVQIQINDVARKVPTYRLLEKMPDVSALGFDMRRRSLNTLHTLIGIKRQLQADGKARGGVA